MMLGMQNELSAFASIQTFLRLIVVRDQVMIYEHFLPLSVSCSYVIVPNVMFQWRLYHQSLLSFCFVKLVLAVVEDSTHRLVVTNTSTLRNIVPVFF